jgi:hypothetical protein
MKCRKVQRLLPLLAGAELPESKIPSVRAHIEECSRCRKDYEKYAILVSQTRAWFAENKTEWQEQEWQRVVRTAIEQGTEKKTAMVPWPFPKVWAYALMASVMFLMTVLIVRPPVVERTGLGPGYTEMARMEKPGGMEKMEEQEVVSMTMVSRETGLKIVWVFNKNFNLEENE